MSFEASRIRSIATWLVVGALLGVSCGGAAATRRMVRTYFERPARDDPWSPKIANWQSRERLAQVHGVPAAAPGAVAQAPEGASPSAEPTSDLRAKYEAFRSRQQRAVARELARWIQDQAKEHYVADGPLDHWATFGETLRRNGDDCDGLELLSFHLLRDLGFPRREVYRAIVHRPADGQHHMVTLWFEDPEDPWVIDPTGAMTPGMPRMSQVPEWVPLKIFSDTEEYSVGAGPRPLRRPGAAATR